MTPTFVRCLALLSTSLFLSCNSAPPTCSDGIRNEGEADIDCGGPACQPCATGRHCYVPADCLSNDCGDPSKLCVAATCSDGVMNGAETDVDCGGPMCPACADGQKCAVSHDCKSGDCAAKICAPATCMDQIKNGAETDVDCGGGMCPACDTQKDCLKNGDCLSLDCAGGKCAAPTCMDKIKNEDETDLDCGGLTCPGCFEGQHCLVGGDCQSKVCTMNVCVAPTCFDMVVNQDETDVDCGGVICQSCADGKACLKDEDCDSISCVMNVCVPATCGDGVKNGNETDVDCGGGTCPGCADGLRCFKGSDCNSGVCAGNVCTTPLINLSALKWTVAGPGTVAAMAANNGGEAFSYSLTMTNAVWTNQTWTYTATSTVTGMLSFDWTYAGYHAWFMAMEAATAFSNGMTVPLYSGGSSGNFSHSGTAMLPLVAGQPFGFTTSGSNFDSDMSLVGTLTITGK